MYHSTKHKSKNYEVAKRKQENTFVIWPQTGTQKGLTIKLKYDKVNFIKIKNIKRYH